MSTFYEKAFGESYQTLPLQWQYEGNSALEYKQASVYVSGTCTEKPLIVFFRDKQRNARYSLSIVKAWVGEIPRAPYVSTEMIAHGMIRHVIAVNSTHGTVIHLHLTTEKDWLQR